MIDEKAYFLVSVGKKLTSPDASDSQIYHYIPVVKHDAVDLELFPEGEFGHNKYDLDNNLYSAADEMARFRGADGLFHFQLCYPGISSDHCFTWSQSSDPMDDTISDVEGFVLHSEPPGFVEHLGFPFIGLLSDSR